MNIEEEYPYMNWDRPLSEIERDMTFIDVFGSVDFGSELSEDDQIQLYKFAKIVNNYTKLDRIDMLSDVKKTIYKNEKSSIIAIAFIISIFL